MVNQLASEMDVSGLGRDFFMATHRNKNLYKTGTLIVVIKEVINTTI